MLRKIPIHPILFAVYPILFLYTNNISMLEIKHTNMPILWSILGVALLWLILNLVTKNRHKSSVLTSIFVVLFFSYGHLYEVISGFTEKTIGMSSDLYLTLNYLLILIISYALILKSGNKFEFTSRYLNFTAVILIIFPIYSILSFPSNTNQKDSIEDDTQLYSNEIDSLQQPENCPDIYYIILDGYARGDVFEEVYNFDNSEFYNELRNLGFIIAEKSRTNYALTLSSLSSTLNMKYLDPKSSEGNYSIEKNYIYGLSQQFSRNIVGDLFKKLGYKFITLTSGISWAEIESSDENITPKHTIDEFENLIISTTPFRTLFRLVPLNSPYYLHKQRILFNLEKLKTIGNRNEPSFIFAHILAPHLPFVLADSSMTSINTVVDFSEGHNYHQLIDSLQRDYRKKYVDQVKVLNSKVLDSIREIRNKSKTSIIVLQSDHGPASLYDWEGMNYASIKERMSILNAFYFPPDANVNLYDSITPVNTFRLIFNNFFNGQFDLLEDRSFFSTLAKPYHFILVDNKNGPIE